MANAIEKENQELLDDWDAYQIVPSVTMGGISPGYEQAIQIAMFEFLRKLLKDGKDFKGDCSFFDSMMGDLKDLGLSGAQASSAQMLAAGVYQRGMQHVRGEVHEDRHTMVSRAWPHLKDPRPDRLLEWEKLNQKVSNLQSGANCYHDLAERGHAFCREYNVAKIGQNVFDIVFDLAEEAVKKNG